MKTRKIRTGASALHSLQPLEARLLLDARLVADVVPGPSSSMAGSDTCVGLGDKLIYMATDESHGTEPWVSNGTAAGTMILKDIHLTTSSDPEHFFVAGSKAYFLASDATNGKQLWSTDGTPAGTKRLTSVAGGLQLYGDEMVAYGSKLLFFEHSMGMCLTDGNAAPVKIASGATGHATVVGERIFFSKSIPDDETYPIQLYVIDGQTGLESEVDSTSDARNAAAFDDWCFYVTPPPSLGGLQGLYDLRRSDRGSSGYPVGIIGDIGTDIAFDPDHPIADNRVYFFTHSTNGYVTKVWAADMSGVEEIFTLQGPTSSSFGGWAVFQNKLYVSTWTFDHGKEIYRVNPYAKALECIGDVAPGGHSSFPSWPVATSDALYFAATDEVHGYELYKYDGTKVAQVKDIAPGAKNASPLQLTAVGSDLFFSADDATHGRELWATPGVAEPPPPAFKVRLAASDTEIDEGDSVTFKAAVTGGKIVKYWWYLDDDSTHDSIAPAPTFKYVDNLPKDAPYTVRLKYLNDKGEFGNATILITVKNLPPAKLRLNMYSSIEEFAFANIKQPIGTVAPLCSGVTFGLTFTDPGQGNDAWFKCDWYLGSARIGDLKSKTGMSVVGHIFPSEITTPTKLWVRVTDKDGASTTRSMYITAGSAGMSQPTATDWPMWITSDDRGQNVEIRKPLIPVQSLRSAPLAAVAADSSPPLVPPNAQDVEVLINGASKGLFSATSLRIYGNGGNDTIRIDPGLTLPTRIEGGRGNDRIYGGGGKDTILGGAGNDFCYGGGGKDVLRGDAGHDFLRVLKGDKCLDENDPIVP